MMKFVLLLVSVGLFNISDTQPVNSTIPYGSINGLSARIRVYVRRRRSSNWDFTQINQNICPASLCFASDEKTGKLKPRPRGTGGSVFYQGDIVLGRSFERIIFPSRFKKRRPKRATMKPRRRLWPKGEVPYKMSSVISDSAKSIIERAIRYIQKRTCVRFRKREKEDEDFVRFTSEEGCWSRIGRVGGQQPLNIGDGCETLGTTVHEMMHALGTWHEQARQDRDKYVIIQEENVSKKFLPNFQKLSRRLVTSRGYPYDYKSLMHYSTHAFTKNAKPTIKVKGIGEKLKFRIGQRRGMSTIDIGQIREMYRCNLQKDINETVCQNGWHKIDTSCYKFVTDAQQFTEAQKYCNKFRSSLLIVNNAKEHNQLQKYLNKEYKDVTEWQMGAILVNKTMVWTVSSKKTKKMKYKNWADNHPGSYETAILSRERDGRYLWKGDWLDYTSRRQIVRHPFVCEKRSGRKCIILSFPDGRDYRGKLDYTRDGYFCQKWTENYPHEHNLTESAKKGAKRGENGEGLGDHNYCRNPKNLRRNRPWCYTTKKNHEWGYCDISVCKKKKQKQYRSSDSRNPAPPNQRRIKASKERQPPRSSVTQRRNSRPSVANHRPTTKPTHSRQNYRPSVTNYRPIYRTPRPTIYPRQNYRPNTYPRQGYRPESTYYSRQNNYRPSNTNIRQNNYRPSNTNIRQNNYRPLNANTRQNNYRPSNTNTRQHNRQHYRNSRQTYRSSHNKYRLS